MTLCHLNVNMSIVPLCPVHRTPGMSMVPPECFFLNLIFKETTIIPAMIVTLDCCYLKSHRPCNRKLYCQANMLKFKGEKCVRGAPGSPIC